MKTSVMLRKAHLNLSILAVTLSVALLLTSVLCTKLLDQSISDIVMVFMVIIMGMMVTALIIGFISYLKHKKVGTIGKWTLSLLSFGLGVLAFIVVFEFFLKP